MTAPGRTERGGQASGNTWRDAVVLALFAIGTCVMLAANLTVERGGVIDNAILNPNDPRRLMDEQVEGLKAKGFRPSESMTLVVPWPDGPNADGLARMVAVAAELEAAFPEIGTLGLHNAAAYRDTGETLSNTPYVDGALVAALRNDPSRIEEWKTRVRADSGVYGLLVGREFDYGQIVLWFPSDANEAQVGRRLAAFYARRNVSKAEEYLRTDFNPVPALADVLPAGWIAGRHVMTLALTRDLLVLTSLGLVLTFVFTFFSLLSWRQALLSTVMISLGFVWTRGTIGVAQWLGFELYERVYFLLILTAVIVANISFSIHKFSAYNAAREASALVPRSAVWRLARPVNRMLLLTAIIAGLNFATLYQIGVKGILEIGVFSAFGIAWSVLLVFGLLPRLHMLVGGESVPPTLHGNGMVSRVALWGAARWNALLGRLVAACGRFHRVDDPCIEGAAYKSRWRLATVMVAAVVLAAGLLLAAGKMQVTTRPLEFIRGTAVYRASEVLNAPGGIGFGRLGVFVSPSSTAAFGGDPAYNPAFIRQAWAFQCAVKGSVVELREVKSVLDSVRVVARESYQSEMPADEQQAYDILENIIGADLGSPTKEHLWCSEGFALVATTKGDDSQTFELFSQGVLDVAKRFPDLEIRLFGKTAAWGRVDRYVRLGTPMNAATSQWMVVLVCAGWVYLSQRRIAAIGRTLRPMRTGLVICLPFVFAWAVITVTMIVLGVPLDQATACITALAVNAAIDFSLYFIAEFQAALRDGATVPAALGLALRHKGRVIITDIALNSLCFLPLVFSHFSPVARLGWIMVVMLSTCGFGALWLMPAILPWCVKRKAVQT